MPSRDSFTYTFEALTDVLEGFTDAVGLDRYALYVFDYGAPTGFRLAVRRPERVTAIITQNGNAYEEGLSDGWNPIRRVLEGTHAGQPRRDPQPGPAGDNGVAVHPRSPRSVAGLARRLHPRQWLPGPARRPRDPARPTSSTTPATSTCIPQFQEYFRTCQPPLLAIWGRNDPFFLPAGAEAFTRDIPDADVQLLDTGHFALETHASEIAAAIRKFLAGGL